VYITGNKNDIEHKRQNKIKKLLSDIWLKPKIWEDHVEEIIRDS
jgi:hypothetical protein